MSTNAPSDHPDLTRGIGINPEGLKIHFRKTGELLEESKYDPNQYTIIESVELSDTAAYEQWRDEQSQFQRTYEYYIVIKDNTLLVVRPTGLMTLTGL